MQDSTEDLEEFVLGDITAAIAVRLREEHLYHFIRSRDELLRLERNDDSETVRLLRRQSLRGLEKTWNSILHALRENLPTLLDQVLSTLVPEFQATSHSPIRSHAKPLPTVSSPSLKAPEPVPEVHTLELFLAPPPEVSEARTPANPSTRHDSATVAPEFRLVKDIDEPAPFAEAGSSTVDLTKKTTDKRPLVRDGADSRSPRKRTKRTSQLDLKPLGPSAYKPIKRNIFLHEIGEQECIFSYGEYAGFYVLRCNQVKCKKELSLTEATTFTSHPFWDGLALEHFSEGWHGLTAEDDVFRKFAIRVIDADSERNTDNKTRKEAIEKRVAKGKWPERWYNLSEFTAPASEPSTSKSAVHANETFKESFYRVGTLLSIAESAPLGDEDNRTSPDLATGPPADAERSPVK